MEIAVELVVTCCESILASLPTGEALRVVLHQQEGWHPLAEERRESLAQCPGEEVPSAGLFCDFRAGNFKVSESGCFCVLKMTFDVIIYNAGGFI